MQVRSLPRVVWVAVLLVEWLVVVGAAAAPQAPEHRWGGYVFDPFVRETTSGTFEAWTAEDGGRIRYRNPANGVWSFQTTPPEVKDTLHRIHFLPLGPNQQYGWAVGNNGWVLKTTNGGVTWSVSAQILALTAPGYDELYDVHFLNPLDGWAIGKKREVLYSGDGGTTWTSVAMLKENGLPWSPGHTDEGYSLDIVERPSTATDPGGRLGLAVIQPGHVFRSTDPMLQVWQRVFYLRDLIGNPGNYPCIALTGCEASFTTDFEPWDVEISRHPTQRLALLAGGRGVQCGLVLSSIDDGVTWCKEYHECTCSGPGCNATCSSSPGYNPPANTYRLQSFKTLYGLAIQSSDNSAIAVGYNGQQLVRDPATGVWLDRSVFTTLVPTPLGSVKFPLLGAALAGPNATGQTIAIATGMGGLLRESTDGGHTYSPGLRPTAQGPAPIVGEPHRIKDVYFANEFEGWHVGQHSRIARSTDGGFTWNDQAPQPSVQQPTLHAISIDPNGSIGVAVGDPFLPSGSTTTEPKIRRTASGGFPWVENITITGDPNFIDGKRLNEVEWSGLTATGDNFWAVGQAGLVLHSTDGGAQWNLSPPTSTLVDSEPFAFIELFNIEGVSFKDPTTGLLVGRRPIPSPSGPESGAAYQYREVNGVVSWSTIPLDPNVVVRKLTDVDIAGTVAWAVGEKDVGGVLEGVVLTSVFAGGTFGAFTEVAPPSGGFQLCRAGEDLTAQILNEVEVSPGGTVWVAGMCGRAWKRPSGTWIEVKSQMDAHVGGMSFVPTASVDVGYLAGMRHGQQCIVRVQ
jgi:photosystem II stability/assembly factor-like uncharacterized protein